MPFTSRKARVIIIDTTARVRAGTVPLIWTGYNASALPPFGYDIPEPQARVKTLPVRFGGRLNRVYSTLNNWLSSEGPGDGWGEQSLQSIIVCPTLNSVRSQCTIHAVVSIAPTSDSSSICLTASSQQPVNQQYLATTITVTLFSLLSPFLLVFTRL
jgi:hypothetical protein